MPAFVRLPATKLAARSTSGLFSGNMLMLGMRRKSFNSSSRRCSFCCTKLSVACDMGDDSIIEADAPGSVYDRDRVCGGCGYERTPGPGEARNRSAVSGMDSAANGTTGG